MTHILTPDLDKNECFNTSNKVFEYHKKSHFTTLRANFHRLYLLAMHA